MAGNRIRCLALLVLLLVAPLVGSTSGSVAFVALAPVLALGQTVARSLAAAWVQEGSVHRTDCCRCRRQLLQQSLLLLASPMILAVDRQRFAADE